MELIINVFKSPPPLGNLDLALYICLALLVVSLAWSNMAFVRFQRQNWLRSLGLAGLYLSIAIINLLLGIGFLYIIMSHQNASMIVGLAPEMIDRQTALPFIGLKSTHELAQLATHAYYAIKAVVVCHLLVGLTLLAHAILRLASWLFRWIMQQSGNLIDQRRAGTDPAPWM